MKREKEANAIRRYQEKYKKRKNNIIQVPTKKKITIETYIIYVLNNITTMLENQNIANNMKNEVILYVKF